MLTSRDGQLLPLTTDAWRELMGVAKMRHDTQRNFRIERLVAGNPLVKGIPREWGQGSDELYNIDKMWPTATPLVEAGSIEGQKHFPVVWTNTSGKARVFTTRWVTPAGRCPTQCTWIS